MSQLPLIPIEGETFKQEYNFSHTRAVEIAYKWILKNGSVGVAFKELKSSDNQIPDVIGFSTWESTLIECKVSRSDFFADKKKPHHENGMGNWRFYCCPKGMIKKHELPEKWGLIYYDENGKARIEHDCRWKKRKEKCPDIMLDTYPDGYWYRTEKAEENKFVANLEAEKKIMYTALRRLFLRGFMKHIYEPS